MKFPATHVFNTTLAENFVPQAKELLDVLEESDINKFIENIALTEPDKALAFLSIVEDCTIEEAMVKHVNSQGQLTRTKDRMTRARLATQTTGLSKAKRRQIARKATKTKRSKPSIGTKALRKRKKALKKRKAYGLA